MAIFAAKLYNVGLACFSRGMRLRDRTSIKKRFDSLKMSESKQLAVSKDWWHYVALQRTSVAQKGHVADCCNPSFGDHKRLIRRPLPTAGRARQRRDYKQQVLCSASEGQARGGQKGKPGAE